MPNFSLIEENNHRVSVNASNEGPSDLLNPLPH